MSTIQAGQCEELFGQNETPMYFLDAASKNIPEIKEDLENFKKAIEKFNSFGIDVDISIRGKSIIFQDRAI